MGKSMVPQVFYRFVDLAQAAALWLIGIAAFVSVTATAISLAAMFLWPSIATASGASTVPWFGMQVSVTALLVMLALYLPLSQTTKKQVDDSHNEALKSRLDNARRAVSELQRLVEGSDSSDPKVKVRLRHLREDLKALRLEPAPNSIGSK